MMNILFLFLLKSRGAMSMLPARPNFEEGGAGKVFFGGDPFLGLECGWMRQGPEQRCLSAPAVVSGERHSVFWGEVGEGGE